MTTERAVDSTHRIFVSYIDKSREYYHAQGFVNPYRWASFDTVPFTPLPRPITQCRVTLITTASLIEPDGLPSRYVYSVPADAPPDRLYTDHRSWDKDATHTEDLDSYFPVHRLRELAQEGRIGGVAPRCHGVPTEYSQRKTIEQDAPEILRRCREDAVDAAILTAL